MMHKAIVGIIGAAATLALCLPASATGVFFDMGTADSKVGGGAMQVTKDTVYSAQLHYGWEALDGISDQVRVYEEMGDRRGTPAPPDMWSNKITEDCVSGDQHSRFLVDMPDGEYNVYVLSGTSDRNRYQVWSFGIQAGSSGEQPQLGANGAIQASPPKSDVVMAEGAFQYTSTRLRTQVAGGQMALDLVPMSKWVVSCVLIYDDADAARVEEELIAPLEQWTFFLPPEQQQAWTLEPMPDAGEEPPVTQADVARGFLVFHRPWPEVVYPNALPRPEELNPELRIFATPGEYEPLTVCVHLLRDVEDIGVAASDIGPIASESVDIRHVRYMRVRPNYTTVGRYRIAPDALEPMYMFHDRRRYDPAAPVGLTAGTTHRFWLTVRVPEDAQPGMYEGSVKVSAGGGEVTVPVRLRVLPIVLREDPSKIFGIYYRDPIDNSSRATDDYSKQYFLRQAAMEREDMLAHGTRNIVMSAWMPPADENGNFNPDWTLLATKMEWAERYGFQPPYAIQINTGGVYAKYMGGKSMGSHTAEVEIPPPAFAAEMTAMVKIIEEERIRRGWPTFLYYPVDEPGRDPKSVEFMRIVLQAIRDAGAPTYVTADPSAEQFKPLMPVVNVWCTQPFSPDRETVLADMAARDVHYWCYPNHISGENDHTPVRGARMTYGFGFWRSGFVTLIPWIYSAGGGDQLNYLTSSSMDFMNRHEPDGRPMPVTLWEAFREGYDDYRYIYTLSELIGEGRGSGKPAAAKAADEAQKALDFVWDSIRVQEKYKYDDLWPAADFDAYRWIVAEQILKLQNAMR
ncbi:MAG TPA: hypothetical protein VM283_01255 [Armatimonadota bacterium]|nr:hypothetical protein [Armatimonadota bacterium]